MKNDPEFMNFGKLYDEFLETSFAKNCRSQGVDGELS
jgi:hypothetical protein